MDAIERKLKHHCKQVFRDPSSRNAKPILTYMKATASPLQNAIVHAARPHMPGHPPQLDQFHLSEIIISQLLKRDQANFPPNMDIKRIELINAKENHPSVFFTASSLWN